jgi:hypothetical protein
VSSAVLEARRGREADDADQSRLFDDLRRAAPDRTRPERDPGADTPTVEAAGARGERHPRSGDDRLTLEAHLERIWEGLLAAGAAECPACGGTMEWREPLAACARCGSTLS